MAEAERQRIFSERARNGLSYKSSPLLGSARKYQASEKSSLSESFEGPKCYGSTRNPLQPQCDVKWIGHVLEETDTLQGVAIKYGVTVEQLRRANKIWTNDNIHLLKILKVPVRKNSPHYVEELEVSDDESSADNSSKNESKITNNSNLVKGGQPGVLLNGFGEKFKDLEGSSGEIQRTKETPLSFLQQLDARIKSSKKESEKLRTVSGPKVIADVEKLNESHVADDDLFRPLESTSSRKHRGKILASKRHFKTDRTSLQESDEQFFEL